MLNHVNVKPEIKTQIPANMLSCWQIQYTQKDILTNLTLHAASGQVWKAEPIASDSQMPAYLDEASVSRSPVPSKKQTSLVTLALHSEK